MSDQVVMALGWVTIYAGTALVVAGIVFGAILGVSVLVARSAREGGALLRFARWQVEQGKAVQRRGNQA
ncbi:hypothetical protein [Methylorubrum extorquens]|uniref:hypothetical protein n=1 Tax=Methylorubrum extorquens TaxID=408 RepID=UPI0002E274E7|nr:hypothetical protein [Methylorubrum extorquens]